MKTTLPKKRFTVVDGIVVLFCVAWIFVSSIALYSKDKSSKNAVITTDKDRIEVSLSSDAVFDVESNGYRYKIAVKDGEIYVAEADCPDKICAGMNHIGHNSGTIVCLPGKLSIVCGKEAPHDGADVIIP